MAKIITFYTLELPFYTPELSIHHDEFIGRIASEGQESSLQSLSELENSINIWPWGA